MIPPENQTFSQPCFKPPLQNSPGGAEENYDKSEREEAACRHIGGTRNVNGSFGVIKLKII
jgi:hypothetical protein